MEATSALSRITAFTLSGMLRQSGLWRACAALEPGHQPPATSHQL